MNTRRAVLLFVGLAGVVAAGVFWERGRLARNIGEAGGTPALPQGLANFPRELTERITTATSRANGGSRDALGELSRLYHANGFLSEAMACYAALERIDPKEPRWWHQHAAILAGYGDTETALAHTQRVLALAPDYVPARLRLGDLLLKRNEPAAAVAVYEEILRRGDNPHARFALARIDVEAGRWQEARTRLESVVTQTNYALGYDLVVTVYEQLGLRAQAAAVRGRAKASGAYRDPPDPWIDELIDLCFDAYRLSLVAGSAQRNGDSATAQKLLERAVALTPDDATIRFQLAGVLKEKRDFRSAREQLERCTVTMPEFADAWAHLSALLEEAGDAAGAERIVTTGLTHSPNSPGLHLMRARQQRKAGRAAAAIDSYRRSIQLRPNEADAFVELATLLLQTERAPDAGPLLLRALEVEPDHPTALSLLALTAISASDEAGARRWITRIRAQPRIPTAQAEQILTAFRGQFGREFR